MGEKEFEKGFGTICKNKKRRIRMNIEIYDCYKKNKENSITGPCGENGTKQNNQKIPKKEF